MERALYLMIVFLLAYSEGCPNQCGNLSIPYPFGIGLGCSLDASFHIICNNLRKPPRAYLATDKRLQIIEITPLHVRVKMLNLVFATYDFGGTLLDSSNFAYDFSDTAYSFSNDNWFTGIGCTDNSVMTGLINNNKSFSRGCTSYCPDQNFSGGLASCPYSNDDNVVENGCCRVPVPTGTTLLSIDLRDSHELWRETRLFHASYAFVGEKVSNESGEVQHRFADLDYTRTSTFFNDSWVIKHKQLVLLDWRIIEAKNCREAQKNTSTYACKANSDCVDLQTSIAGYLCNCSKGYQGNPYLALGCQDVDECTMSPCSSNEACINSQGSFLCSCRKGYHDDGKGCIRRPQSKVITILIGVGVGLGMAIVLAIPCYMLWNLLQKTIKRRKKERFFEHLLLQKQNTGGTVERTRLFAAKELERATDHFNSCRIIGEGGQGTVYKGMLSDGKIVAIKKLNRVGEEELEQLINEVVILSQLNHRNVVKLLGCCLATDVPMIVYEFILNGTLSHHLRDPNNSPSWKARLKMAIDIGGALSYLHSGSAVPIYHRDIKSNNILLDEKYIIKIADFGLSKIVALDQTHVQCTKPLGTHGYMDPEYANCGKFTEKSDVYSFGVVLVELLTGEKALSMNTPDIALASRFRASMDSNNLSQMLDARVCQEGRMEEFIAFAKLAERCLNSQGKMRPTIMDVVVDLQRIYQMREVAEFEMLSEMPSTSTQRPYVPKPLMLLDLSKISDISIPSEISEINEM